MVGKRNMDREEWSKVLKLTNFAEAEVIKLLLESDNVRAKIQPLDPVNPHSGVYILVESGLVHRAKWILKNKCVTDAELTYLATGELLREDRKDKHNEEAL